MKWLDAAKKDKKGFSFDCWIEMGATAYSAYPVVDKQTDSRMNNNNKRRKTPLVASV